MHNRTGPQSLLWNTTIFSTYKLHLPSAAASFLSNTPSLGTCEDEQEHPHRVPIKKRGGNNMSCSGKKRQRQHCAFAAACW